MIVTLLLALAGVLLIAPLAYRIILHWPEDRSVLRHWHRCAVCGERLPSHHWIPWVEALRREAPPCQHAQPRLMLGTYLFFIAMGIILGVTHLSQPWPVMVQSLLMVGVFFPLAVIDLNRLEVEPRLIVLGLAGRFIGLGLTQPALLMDMLGGMLVGAGFFTMVNLVYQTLRHRSGLGDGDAPMLGLIGAFVGWQGILPVVALSALAGLLIAPPLLLAMRKKLNSPIPYVPFLAIAGCVIYLLEVGWPGLWWQALAGQLPVWGDLLRTLVEGR